MLVCAFDELLGDVVTFAEPLSPAEVGCAILMQPRGELDAQLPQQREQEPAAVVAVGQDQIAARECVAATELLEQRAEGRAKQRAKQCGLAGLLARVRSRRQRDDHPGGERGQRDGPSKARLRPRVCRALVLAKRDALGLKRLPHLLGRQRVLERQIVALPQRLPDKLKRPIRTAPRRS